MANATKIAVTSLPDPTADPIDLFKMLIAEIKRQKPGLITMDLATVNEAEGVLSRTVVYRGLSSNNGITFATDRDSRKYTDILKNCKVALTFLFQLKVNGVETYQQVRINGVAKELPQTEILQSWNTDSAFGKVRSLINREKPEGLDEIKLMYQNLMNDYEAGQITIPLPDTHTVLEVHPNIYDFYQSAANCVADSVIYRKENNRWEMQRSFG